jgi:serine/threonine protein kinase
VRVRTERTGKIFDLHEPFRSGGEGAIYEVPHYPNLVAKVYHAQRRTPERIAKLQIMVAHPPVNPTEHLNHPSIAWPTELLRDTATNQLVGFVMPRVRQMLPLSEVYNPRARRRQLPLFNYRYLVRTARNLCAAVQAVHQAGYVIGDLNESNVLVSDQALVTLVDADSFQVRDPETGVVYRSLVGKPEYTPPELQGCSFADVDRQPEHDAFALAVLIFRLLMEGFHPFDGVYRGRGEPPEMGARIRNGYFPYARGRTGIEPSPLAPPFEMLHPDLQALFVRCFAEGHRNRRVRPRVEDWLEALEGAEDALQQCGQNEQHYYWVHWSGCPWCARQQALGGRDPFPSRASVSSGQHLGVSGRQQPLPSASATTPAPTPVHTAANTYSSASVSPKIWSLGLVGFGDIAHRACVINLLPDGSPRTLKESKQGGEDDARTLLPDGSPVRTLTGYILFVRSVSFSPDGSLLASGSGIWIRPSSCGVFRMVRWCAPSRGTQMGSPACRFRRMGVCWRRGVWMAPSSCGVWRMVRWCAPSRGTQNWSTACRFRRMGACWRRGVVITPSSCGVFRMVRWCAPSRGTQMGLQRVVFAGWAFAGVGEFGWHHQVVACFGWFVGAHPHGAHIWGQQRVVFAGWAFAGVGEFG